MSEVGRRGSTTTFSSGPETISILYPLKILGAQRIFTKIIFSSNNLFIKN